MRETEPEAEVWWATLSDVERIRCALLALEYGFTNDKPSYIAEKPWRYIEEAWRAKHMEGR